MVRRLDAYCSRARKPTSRKLANLVLHRNRTTWRCDCKAHFVISSSREINAARFLVDTMVLHHSGHAIYGPIGGESNEVTTESIEQIQALFRKFELPARQIYNQLQRQNNSVSLRHVTNVVQHLPRVKNNAGQDANILCNLLAMRENTQVFLQNAACQCPPRVFVLVLSWAAIDLGSMSGRSDA
jgi:hypothetical protein